MKILAFSDIHEEEAALERLRFIAKSHDRVLICGDSSQNISFALSLLDSFPNGFIVPGNWDNEAVGKILAKSPHCVHGKRVEIEDGLNVVGFGYSMPTPFGTFGEVTEEEMYAGLSKLPIDSNTILLLHSPPKGHFDEVLMGRLIGSESVLRIIEEKKPLAALFGHVHEHMGSERYKDTVLIKVPPANRMRACSLEIKDKKIDVDFISL